MALRSCLATALIAVGLGIMVRRAGLADIALWPRTLHAWPVLLVAWGLEEVYLARGQRFPVALAVVLTVAAIAAAWLVPTRPAELSPGVTDGRQVVPVQSEGGVYDLEVDAGAIELELTLGTGRDLEVAFAAVEPLVESAPGKVRVREAASREGFLAGCSRARGGRWTLRLPPEVPTRVAIDVGAGGVDADLRGVQLRSFSVDAGASRIRLALPTVEGEVPVRVKAGASSIHVEVPEEVGVRVRADLALGSLSVKGLELGPGAEGWRETPGYETAARRLRIEVEGAASSLTLVRRGASGDPLVAWRAIP